MNRPILNSNRINKLVVVYENTILDPILSPEMIPPGSHKDLSPTVEKRVRDLAKYWKINNVPLVCLDIERWPALGNDEAINMTINNFKTIIGWIHDESPKTQVGIYGFLPIRDLNRAQNSPGSAPYQYWQNQNDRLKPLANIVDVIFPSLYTLTADPDKWKTFATAMIQQAKLYNKPVYPYIWPRYHQSISKLPGEFLPKSFWKMELKTVKSKADGTVIWDYVTNIAWDENSTWWKTFKSTFNF